LLPLTSVANRCLGDLHDVAIRRPRQ